MTAIELAHRTDRTGRMATAVAALRIAAVAMARLYRVRRNRAAVLHLSECSDHMLADIGITRGDVRAVLGSRPFDDPSERLGALAELRMRQAAARNIA